MRNFVGWIWKFLPSSARFWVVFYGLVLIIIFSGFLFYKSYDAGYDKCEAKHIDAGLLSVDEKLDLKAKQDEIQNAPLDHNVTVRRMRKHTF